MDPKPFVAASGVTMPCLDSVSEPVAQIVKNALCTQKGGADRHEHKHEHWTDEPRHEHWRDSPRR